MFADVIPAEDTPRTRLLIAHSVLEQCNAAKLASEQIFWNQFAFLYEQRVPDSNGREVAQLIKGILSNN